MPIRILMPALSPTMTEGNLAKWHKQVGDDVKPGDVIAEIETDKATMEVEAAEEGKLAKIVVPAGTQGVKVNDVIALLVEEGEEAGLPETPSPPPAPGAAAAPRPSPAAPATKPAAATPAQQAAAPGNEAGERTFASPLARRMAAQAGLDLRGITGSGPHGRIVKSDVDMAVRRPPIGPLEAPPGVAAAAPPAVAAPQARPAAPAPMAAVAGLPSFIEQPNNNIRKTIARRLTEAKRDQPHFYLTIDCAIDQLLKTREELNRRSDKYKLSVNDFVIRAAALALQQVPAANASWTESAVRLYQSADISVAVAVPSGLITPIVRGAERKGLAAISNEMKDLAARARAGKLRPEEYQGGTFSVSNLGMYGIREFAAVINPPQGAILAVGAGEQRPVVRDGALAIATMMTCTLSCDHRVVDGVIGAEFLGAFRKLIEDPLTMLL